MSSTENSLRLRVLSSIDEVDEAAWNALVARDPPPPAPADRSRAGDAVEGPAYGEGGSPFVEWAFLEALEHSGCASEASGWTPRHLALFRGARLIAAAPAYLRTDSDGDFSRDWHHADALARAGRPYYPKLSITVPFTPVTGRRFLVAPAEDGAACTSALVRAAFELARDEGCHAVQVLFPLAEELPALEEAGLHRRVSHQFHWRNRGYRDPADFLSRFDSKRRNQLKRERAAPARQGIAVRTVRGDELSADPAAWARAAHGLHRSTVEKLHWGRGWLNLAFYERLFARMPHRLELVEARREGRLVAGAFNVASATRLFGRYWGCHEEHPFLHFNVCLYHSIDECIARGTLAFEGGAGGEHKIARGFEPAETYSATRLLDARLDAALAGLIARENRQIEAGLARFREESPIFKKSPPATTLGRATEP